MDVTFDQLLDVVSNASAWAYAVVAAVAFLDALLPLVPSETAVIAAGVAAAAGELRLSLVIALAAAGAFAGDNVTYTLGRRFGSRLAARPHSERTRGRLDWARRQLDRRGGELIVIGRFIPGGRTAVNLTAGSLRYPWPRFALYDATAVAVWASYAAGLGYLGGEAFEESPWKGLALALAIAFAAAATTELVRLHRRRG